MSTDEGEVEASTPEADDSVGARLVAARTAAQWSVAEVAQRLHCGPNLIEALEANRFADLGAPVFARGHLRRYSELLGLPIEAMLAQWSRQENREPVLPDLTRVPRAEPAGFDWRPLQPYALGVAAVAVFAILLWVVLTQTAPAPVRSEPIVAASPTVTESPPPISPATTAEPAVEMTEPPTAGVTQSQSEESWPARASIVAQRGGFSLALAVNANCWIEIYDKDGNPLFYDMAQAGRRIQVSGAAPVRVRLGLAEAVTLEYLDRRGPVPPELIRESLAHFTLSADGTFRRYVPPAAPTLTIDPSPLGT